jgi:dolichol-phosphate mannosyltransferase
MFRLSSPALISRTPKIGVVIPIYGESDPICWVLARFRKDSIDTICLVIDVPVRRVMERIREAARQTGITVHMIKNRSRMGIGYALKQGLGYLLDTDHDIVVIMSGNGKDDPAEIDRIIEPVAEAECDYVQGSRYLRGGSSSGLSPFRAMFNRLFPLIWTALTQKKCTDVTNGYRCYRLSFLKDPRINLNQAWLDAYSLEYYLHYKALALGYRVKEVAVSRLYRFGGRGSSKIQPLKDWWPIISPIVLLFLGVRK